MYNYNYGAYGNQYNPYATPRAIQEMKQMRDQLDANIQQAQQSPQQPMLPNQPTNLTQNFQLAPQTSNTSELESHYAENIDEVKNTFVMRTGIFATKDYSTIWIKDVSGNITTFKTEEVKQLDEKDLQIQALKEELENMKYMLSQSTSQSVEIEQPKTTKISKTSNKK